VLVSGVSSGARGRPTTFARLRRSLRQLREFRAACSYGLGCSRRAGGTRSLRAHPAIATLSTAMPLAFAACAAATLLAR